MIYVIDNDGEKSEYQPKKITHKIMEETGLDKEEAEKIQRSITYLIKDHYQEEYVSTTTLRSIINQKLIQKGYIEEEQKSQKLGMSISDFEELLQNGNNDNANIQYSPEMINKYASDSIAKQYALYSMPEDCSKAHIDGYVHHHDLEHYNLRPNCLSGNNNIILKNEDGNIFYSTIKEFVENIFNTEEIYYVPSLNVKTNKMEWKEIENAYLSSQNEQTYLVTFGKGYSIECTSDHKFIKSHNNKAQKDYDIKVSEFDNFKDLRLCNITNLHYVKKESYQWSVLFGFFLGDGYLSKEGNIKFMFSKRDKAEYLKTVLTELGIDFSYTMKENDNYVTGESHSFYIKDKLYPLMSKSNLIHYYKEHLNLKGVLEGLINSDGHVRLDINNVLRLNFTNTNKDIFDLYQLTLLSNGIRGSISVHEPSNPKHNISYNSSSFGQRLKKLLSEIRLCERFQKIVNQSTDNMKTYEEIGELRIKSIEYTGEQPVYNLTVKDNHNYMAGINGFVLTQNCMNYDLRFFARNGLKIDGKGLMGSVSKPAKSLEVLLNHMLQAFMAGATVFSGGQGYANFNTLLAPFCRGRTYKEIKQAIQGFIFNCNMSLVCRGGQVLFSSIALDLSCPDVLANEPAVTFGGITQGTYKDYQEEADMIFRAVCEVSNEKDGQGRWHRFPNILFNIREGDLDEYSGTCKLLHETGANNPTIYYTNCTDLERTIMGCFSGDTKLHFWYDGKHYFETFSFIDNLINADYGVTDVNNFKILGLVDYEDSYWKDGEEIKFTSKIVRYVEASKFIKNEHRRIYHVILEDGSEFDCDDTHTMILCNGLYQKADIFEAFNNHLKICNIIKEPMSDKEGYLLNLGETYIKDIIVTNNYEDTYCFEADGTIIVDEFILTGNCRTALPMNYRKNYDDDCLNTGNFMYTTINLPLIAYESKDEKEFYKTLDYYCEIVYKTLHHRRAEVEKALYDLHTSDFLLQKDDETGKPLYSLDRATYTIGFCGLNEALLELYGNGVLDVHDEGIRIVQFLNDKKNEFNNRDGWRWSVIGSPAESTSSRFAKINKEKHADAVVQGEKGNYYLTNSSHIPVSDTSDIVEHIKNADTYHPITLAGNLLHIWLGEVWSDPEALWKLNQKILKTNTRFWAYSKVFTYCQECEFTINDNLKKCPICGSEDLVVYDRITGYYLPVITRRGDDVSQQWNNGKLQEFKDRYRHDNVLSEK